MKTKNAIEKLKKAGFKVENVQSNRYEASKTDLRSIICFFDQEGSVVCLHIEYKNDRPDSQTDYFPGIWSISSLKYAIERAEAIK